MFIVIGLLLLLFLIILNCFVGLFIFQKQLLTTFMAYIAADDCSVVEHSQYLFIVLR